ncbi:hypothetical protein IMG5_151310 [Ichthyophthirius multifiliis]|uniref:cAMP-dependent protein kinase regulatory subunit n=1 Tax=Ichthyophthirius multifiliis TaxID=5932 RepID=G0QYN4_ICHMU|nr:hypothetical protein IMG5_151310 [Ichthyophthirius multifiliis]EGR29661.1 hypothetical protein IMG5_151310 [Ichthyophthirius multifiliis]|eukprot:XP_004030897.1 hypothetical protein IMG5_151310 [Ichthyophthirius multifiliis]
MDRQQYENYLKEKLHPILEKMLIDCLQAKPADPIPFLIQWLQNKQCGGAAHAQSAQAPLQQKAQAPANQDKKKKKSKKESDEEKASSDEDEDDYVEVVQTHKEKGKPAVGRASVSAEAFGQFNQKKAFKPKIIQKKPEQIQKITQRLSQAFMFSALDDGQRKIVIDAMDEKRYKAGELVIQQGEDGDVLYVVDEGELDCEKVFKKGDKATYLKTYQPGESFGELSLLYNAPRAASIRAKTNAILYSLDRDTFNNIVKDAAAKKREFYESFLQTVELLKDMDNYERSKIGDALKSITFKKGSYVVKEGDSGDDFFMIEEGQLQALKQVNPGQDPVVVKEYKQGDYFGELALLKNCPRQASIKCVTDVKLATLDRSAFKRLLGPVDTILGRNADNYKKFQK